MQKFALNFEVGSIDYLSLILLYLTLIFILLIENNPKYQKSNS